MNQRTNLTGISGLKRPQLPSIINSTSSKIRVVHLVFSFATGGMEKGICTTINHGSSEFEHIIVCLTSSEEMARRLPQGTRVISMDKKPGNSFTFLYRLSRLLKQLQPAVIHTRNWSGIDGVLAARAGGIKTIFHGEHGWGMDDPYGMNPKRGWIRRFAVGDDLILEEVDVIGIFGSV